MALLGKRPEPAKPIMQPPPGDDAGDPGESGRKIEDDPKAMQLVDELAKMGYTGEDVAQAMDALGGGMDSGQEATKAAPMQIPMGQ